MSLPQKNIAEGSPRGIAVLDAGYTNTKLTLFDADLCPIAAETEPSVHRPGPPYAAIDPEPVVAFAARLIGQFDTKLPVDRVVPCAHGSGLACLDQTGNLALPVMDYEAEPPGEVVDAYAELEPPFPEVFAPTNPAALTLGRQLLWQQTAFPEAFSRIKTILPWGQYLTFRLTGVEASEVSALGAQTHLWDISANRFSSLAHACGWDRRFAAIRRAYETLGQLLPQFRCQGFRGDGQVLVGVHDSNANYLRYLATGLDRFTLLSSGTWIIGFDSHAKIETRDPRYDIVSNTTVFGKPVACSRFMGGREFEIVAAGAVPEAANTSELQRIVDSGVYALPSFTHSGGPMPGTGGQGRVVGPTTGSEAERATLAALYCALMSAEALDHVGSSGDIVIDGPFARSSLYCAVLAALFPSRTVYASEMRNGTSAGAALLALIGSDEGLPKCSVDLRRIAPAPVAALTGYRERWRSRCER